jgi:LPXTG-motif cell wall-anchored protein
VPFSTGAKAGIGAGVALGALAVLALAFFIYWKRKHAYTQARQSSPTAAQPVHELNSGKGAYDTPELPVGTELSELPSGKEKPLRGEEVHEIG